MPRLDALFPMGVGMNRFEFNGEQASVGLSVGGIRIRCADQVVQAVHQVGEPEGNEVDLQSAIHGHVHTILKPSGSDA